MTKKAGGFLVVEILFVLGAVLLTTVWLGANTKAWYEYRAKLEVQLMAQNMAREIQNLQQRAMLSYNGLNMQLRVRTSASDYYVLHDYEKGLTVGKEIKFASLGHPDIRIKSSNLILSFSPLGAPTATPKYYIRHQLLSDYENIVEVQPVTGRVVISEKK